MPYVEESSSDSMLVPLSSSVFSDASALYPPAVQPISSVPLEYGRPKRGNYRRVRTLDSIPSGVLNSNPQSWYDLSILPPLDPRHLVADARVNSIVGTFTRSTTFLASTWAANTAVFTGTVIVQAYETDNLLKVEEAAQWTLAHQGGNFNATVAPPLRRVLFLRGGRQWKNTLTFALGGITASEVQLSFRDNAASSGNFTGTAAGSIPVIKWTGPASGTLTFELALKQYGRFNMAVKITDTLGNHSMFEMEWIVVK